MSDFLTARLAFGFLFSAFALVWIVAASAIGNGVEGGDLFPLFGIPFVLIGLHLMIGVPIWDAYERSHSWYALSEEAAYIATELFGKRKLTRYAIADMNALELEDALSGTVWFRRDFQVHTTTRRSRNGSPYRQTHASTARIGFKRIDSARTVYGMILRLIRNLERNSVS
ncbi:MAG: hypothetical protein ABS75_21090 [Pelagibacterium sp. SCN 63-23]|nr:MAG: hypothetical protein ABS75_21090 [Pelagibacterium sp. SCN 63-23]